jgi:hypothetical protein
MSKLSIKYNNNPSYCKQCNTVLQFKKRHYKFCSSSCAAKFNNTGRILTEDTKNKICKSLNESNKIRHKPKLKCERYGCTNLRGFGRVKYCSKECLIIVRAERQKIRKRPTCIHCDKPISNNKGYCKDCKLAYNKINRIKDWLAGKDNGRRGKTATVYWIKKYLIDLRGNKCERCGWHEVNTNTNKTPIELHHIDGDFRNNKIENIILLCPNCHSLTLTYRGANKINGRPRKQYFSRKKY